MALPENNNNNPSDNAGADDKPAQDLASREIDFHGAAVIDEDGNVTPITEEMVQKACAELEEASNPGKES